MNGNPELNVNQEQEMDFEKLYRESDEHCEVL